MVWWACGGALPPRALGGGARVRMRVGGRSPPPLLTGTRRCRNRRQRRIARASRKGYYHLKTIYIKKNLKTYIQYTSTDPIMRVDYHYSK